MPRESRLNHRSRTEAQAGVPHAKWGRLLNRIGQMSGDEFLVRCRQELAKRTDVVLSRLGVDFANGFSPETDPDRPVHFFFPSESVGSLLETLRQRLPAQVEEIVRQADQICEHRFDLLGFKGLNYGNPIDWHLDAAHEKHAPRKPFYQVNYLDFHEVGDSKVVWELNRHQHLVTLAKAFLLTKRQRYTDEIMQQWHHWHVENPYPIGINWASSLEVAFRSLSWNWMYYLLEESSVFPPDFRKSWLLAQALNGRHIERYLSTYFSPNTHLLGEGVALFLLGTLCPELPAAGRWKSRGWKIVLQETQRQIQPDGFHFEQSVYYHVYAIDLCLHAMLLASANGMTVPKTLEESIERMLNALFLLGRAGPLPRFGDDDGGRLFDPHRNDIQHLLDPLVTGAILFRRGDFKAVAGDLREETVWLLGGEGVAEWDCLEPQPPDLISVRLQSAGVHLCASADPASQLVIDAGPQGAQSAGHRHADALSICLQAEGRPLLIDPGTFTYVSDGPQRDLFRGTAMHSTLRVDGVSQAEPAGPFSWHRLPRVRIERWITGETFDLFVGSHDGYSRLLNPVIHRRRVFSSKSGLYLVWDSAQGEGQHRLDISWHLAPGLIGRGQHIFGMEGAAPGIAILPADGHGWIEELCDCEFSPVYGEKEAAWVLNFGISTTLPAEFVTLLLPLQDTQVNPGKLTRDEDASSAVRAYHYRSQTEECDFILAEKGAPWNRGSVSSDAEFVYLGSKSQHDERAIIFCNGRYLTVGGQTVLATERVVSRCELIVSEGERKIVCSEPEALDWRRVDNSKTLDFISKRKLLPVDKER